VLGLGLAPRIWQVIGTGHEPLKTEKAVGTYERKRGGPSAIPSGWGRLLQTTLMERPSRLAAAAFPVSADVPFPVSANAITEPIGFQARAGVPAGLRRERAVVAHGDVVEGAVDGRDLRVQERDSALPLIITSNSLRQAVKPAKEEPRRWCSMTEACPST